MIDPVANQRRSAMLELMGHPAWDVYQRALEGLENDVIQRLAHVETDHRYWQGQLAGMRLVFHLPARLVKQGELNG